MPKNNLDDDQAVIDASADNPDHTKPAYDYYFEFQLKQKDFGKSRAEHNKICNEQLIAHIKCLEGEGRQLLSDISNAALIENVTSNMGLSPSQYTWEHCSSSTADGRFGVMRLVPRSQHNPKSEYWDLFHRDYRYRGGYFEWAVPAGAPAPCSQKYAAEFRTVNDARIPILTASELPLYLRKAVHTNNFKNFQSLIERAEAICSPAELKTILTQPYHADDPSKVHTLLHLAAANGYMPLINTLIKYANGTHIHGQNFELNTPAHIAAENNRVRALRKLILSGADLSQRNKTGQTVKEILIARGYASTLDLLPISHISTEFPTSELPDSELASSGTAAGSATRPIKDPAFTFASLIHKTPSQSQGSASAPRSIQPTFNGHYTFKDVLRKQFGEKRAAHFIAKAEAAEKQPPKPVVPAPAPKYTFKDVLRKQFGEKRAAHFIAKAEAAEQQPPKPVVSAPPEKYTFKDVLRKQFGEKRAAHFIAKAEAAESKPQTVAAAVSQPTKPVQPTAKLTSSIIGLTFRSERRKQIALQPPQPKAQQQAQPRAQQQAQPRVQQQAQPRAQQQAQPRAQQQAQPRAQQQAQPRAQQQAQPRAQQQAQPRAQQQTQPRAQQQVQPRAQQQVQQRTQQQTQQRTQQQTQQRTQQQTQQRTQQQTQQRTQQQAQQRTQQQTQQRTQQQAQQRIQQQTQQRTQQQAQQRAQQQTQQEAQRRAVQQAAQAAVQKATQQAAQAAAQKAAQQAAQAAAQKAAQQAAQAAAQRAAQQAAQAAAQRAAQQAAQAATQRAALQAAQAATQRAAQQAAQAAAQRAYRR